MKTFTEHSIIRADKIGKTDSVVPSTQMFSLYIFILIATLLYMGYNKTRRESRVHKITGRLQSHARDLFTKRDIARITSRMPQQDFVKRVDTIIKLMFDKRRQISHLFITAPQLISKRLESLPTSLQLRQDSTDPRKLKRYLQIMFPFFGKLSPDIKDRIVGDIVESIRSMKPQQADRFRDIIYDKISSEIVEYLRQDSGGMGRASTRSISRWFTRKMSASSLLDREVMYFRDDNVAVSIGFELETIRACFVKLDTLETISYQRKKQVHDSGMPVLLTDTVSITGDYIRPQNTVLKIWEVIQRYKPTLTTDPIFQLRFEDKDNAQNKHAYPIPTKSCDLNRFFGSLEWIVTFRDPKNVRIENVFRFMVEEIRKAISLIKDTFAARYLPHQINITSPPHFPLSNGFFDEATNTLVLPYPIRYFAPHIALIVNDQEWEYDAQCTFGARSLTDIYKIMLYLYKVSVSTLGERMHYTLNPILPAFEILQECKSALSDDPDWGAYLFLFVYSFLTRLKRKKEMAFLFRFLFSSIWPRVLGGLGRDKIQKILSRQKSTMSDILNAYHRSYRKYYRETDQLPASHPHDFDSLMEYYDKIHSYIQSQQPDAQSNQNQQSTYFSTENGIYLFEFRWFGEFLKGKVPIRMLE